MRIAVVGAGVSGLVCAWLLSRSHEVVLYEKEPRLGGHAHTVEIEFEERRIPVDTGFIVYNERNYPNFTRILDRLGVETKPSPMTFGVRDDRTGLEYGGASLNALFAQRSNLCKPRFHRMVRDILRFYRDAAPALTDTEPDASLGDFLRDQRYSDTFRDSFLYPMAAAIWSSPVREMQDFPLAFLVRFFDNHGMLSLNDRPQWRTLVGGSREYVGKIHRALGDTARVATPVRSVRRVPDGVEIATEDGAADRFDEAVLACHSDEALAVLEDADDTEREILGAILYRDNDAVLHWDRSVLPHKRRAWSSWNYRVTGDETDLPIVTYNMTILQSLGTREPVCVSLNQTDSIDSKKVLGRFRYAHPVYSHESIRAGQRYEEIGGARRIHFAGAYWFNGFHEDGVRSALRVCEHFGEAL